MKKISIIASLLLMAAASTEAKIRRVGYFGSIVANTDYGSFALAYAAAAAGDTILVFPGSTISGNISKKLILIGNGNWLDPDSDPKGNAGQQAFISTSNAAGALVFLTGSEGSVVSGFHFNGNQVQVGANDITIRRNRDILVNLGYNPNGGGNTPLLVNNLTVLENYGLTIFRSYNVAGLGFTNVNISNNFMEYIDLGATSLNTYSGNISNNVWAYDGTAAATNGGASALSNANNITLGNGAFLFQNNILASVTNIATPASNINYFLITGGGNTVFNHNLVVNGNNGTGIGAGTGNVVISSANAANIFVAFPVIGSNSADARYKLKAASPALVANRPGSTDDAGMYDGITPYKLSTIPSIPTIYSLSSPQGNNPTGNTIQINLSTRGNN